MFFWIHIKKGCTNRWNKSSLELDHLTLALLVTSQFEMLATFQWSLLAVFAVGTFHTKHDFLGCLGLETRMKVWGSVLIISNGSSYLLSEDGFGLTTETLLFTIVTTTTLRSFPFLRLLVLWHFMDLVCIALAAVRATNFWDVNLESENFKISCEFFV